MRNAVSLTRSIVTAVEIRLVVASLRLSTRLSRVNVAASMASEKVTSIDEVAAAVGDAGVSMVMIVGAFRSIVHRPRCSDRRRRSRASAACARAQVDRPFSIKVRSVCHALPPETLSPIGTSIPSERTTRASRYLSVRGHRYAGSSNRR